MEPPTRCHEDLSSGREPCQEKSKGTGAAAGWGHKLRRKTKQKPHAMAMRAPQRPTTRTTATTLRVAGASAVCAVPCSVVFAVRCAIHSSVRCPVPFYPTADECSCAKGTHWEVPTASIHGHGDASVFGPNGALVLRDTGFYERTTTV